MIPLVAAAGTGLAKLGIGAKLASALGAAKGLVGLGATKGAAAAKVGSAMKSAAGLPGVVASAPARMAGTRLAGAASQASPAFTKGIGKAVFGNMDKGQIAMRLAPDLMFGGVAMATTPGDIGDRLIAGSTQAIGGGLGGLALGRAAGRFGDTAATIADMGGSIAGDVVGMQTGDAVMRAKDSLLGGEGQTPFERLGAEQQAQLEAQIRAQTLLGAGLIPGYQQQYL